MKKQNIAITILLTLGITACSHSNGDNSSLPKINKPVSETIQPTKTKKSESTKTTEIQKQKEAMKPVDNKKSENNKTAEIQKQKEAMKPVDNKKSENINSKKPQISVVPAQDNYFNKKSSYTSTGFYQPASGGDIIEFFTTNKISNNNNRLYIDDKKIAVEIFPEGINANSINIRTNDSIRLATRNQHTLWAAFYDPSKSDQFYAIANGINPTRNMDLQVGNVKYIGSGYHSYKSEKEQLVNNSTVEMNADFNNKTILGTITSPTKIFEPISFGAKITNNSFQGTLNDVTTYGGFFGPNAEEAVGRYADKENNAYGVFGVKK